MSEHYQLRKVASAHTDLGESPVRDERNGLLYFIDISAGWINALIRHINRGLALALWR